MTKCHLILSFLLCLSLLGACKKNGQGPSLSEYGDRSEATRFLRFEQYVIQLRDLPLEEACRRQDSLLRATEPDSAAWQLLVRMEEQFLIDPNSPYRDQERYLPVAEHLLTSPNATEEQQYKARWILPRLHLNRIGAPAADFAFLTPTGRSSSLYAAIDGHDPKPGRTLLFFSNPGCPNCKEITDALSGDPDIQAQIASGDLLVINIYPDEDLQAWFDYLPEYPKSWICGYDPDQVLNSSTRYWLQAIPSLYLLDEEKRVLRKDAPLQQILIDCKQR